MNDTPEGDAHIEAMSKKTVALIALVGTIGAGLISGLVSHLASSRALQLDQQRLESQDTLARAEMFHSLLERVSDSRHATYALLALWKIYPEDKKLIVITALQNPSIQTLTALRALGYEEELRQYEDAMKSIMVSATKEQRDQYSSLFIEILPNSVLEISLDAALRQNYEQTYFSGAALEIVQHIRIKPNLAAELENRIVQDSRIRENDRVRISISLALYASGLPKAMHALFDEMNIKEKFARLAPLMTPELIESLKVEDRERLMDLTLSQINHSLDNIVEVHYVNDSLDLLERIRPRVPVFEEREVKLKQMYIDLFMHLAERGEISKIILQRISEFSPEVARRFYLYALECHEHGKAELFFLTFDANVLSLGEWDPEFTFDEARAEAIRQRSKSQSDCEERS